MEVKGLYVNVNDEVLDKATIEAQQLNLLASGDGVEVMTQEVGKGITFDIYPAEDGSSMMEFFYLLEGELEYLPEDGEPINIKKGDYFYTKKLDRTVLFRTITDIKILYVASQPIFQYLGEAIEELYNLTKAVEEKDEYTQGHSERVQELAIKTGLEMKLDRESISNLALSALFHDVGKISVPDSILKKDSSLTDDEYEIIKKHVKDSSEFVGNVKYADITRIVEQHHERIDGSGYPYGLKEDDICIEAKIIAVVDSFDAMTSDRSYRKGMDEKVAIDEIKSLSGIKYCNKVVDAFLRVMDEIK